MRLHRQEFDGLPIREGHNIIIDYIRTKHRSPNHYINPIHRSWHTLLCFWRELGENQVKWTDKVEIGKGFSQDMLRLRHCWDSQPLICEYKRDSVGMNYVIIRSNSVNSNWNCIFIYWIFLGVIGTLCKSRIKLWLIFDSQQFVNWSIN